MLAYKVNQCIGWIYVKGNNEAVFRLLADNKLSMVSNDLSKVQTEDGVQYILETYCFSNPQIRKNGEFPKQSETSRTYFPYVEKSRKGVLPSIKENNRFRFRINAVGDLRRYFSCIELFGE